MNKLFVIKLKPEKFLKDIIIINQEKVNKPVTVIESEYPDGGLKISNIKQLEFFNTIRYKSQLNPYRIEQVKSLYPSEYEIILEKPYEETEIQ